MKTAEEIETKSVSMIFRVTPKERKHFEKLRKETGLSYSEMLRKSAEIISAAVNKRPLNISEILNSSKEVSETVSKTITKAKK
jgi:CO dehydrogenase nickel-insertion accessory protein CooC1